MDAQEQISPQVNSLILICNQRAATYKYIAENIKDLQMQTLFDQYARQAATFAKQLAPFIDTELSGQQLEISENVRMELDEAMAQGNALDILEYSVQEETNAINAYEQVINEKLSSDLIILLENQLEKVKASQNNFDLYLQCLKNINLN